MGETSKHIPTARNTAISAELSELITKQPQPKQGEVVEVFGEKFKILALQQSVTGFGGVAAVRLGADGKPTDDVRVSFPGTDTTDKADLLANSAALKGGVFVQAIEAQEFTKVALNNYRAVAGENTARFSVYGHSASAATAYNAAEYLNLHAKVPFDNFSLNITEPAYLRVAVESAGVEPSRKQFFETLRNSGNFYGGAVVNADGALTYPMRGNQQDLELFPTENLYSIELNFDAGAKIAATQAHRMAEVLPALKAGKVLDRAPIVANTQLAELVDGKYAPTEAEARARADAPMFINYLLMSAKAKPTATPTYMDIAATPESEGEKKVALVTGLPNDVATEEEKKKSPYALLEQFAGNFSGNGVMMFIAAIMVFSELSKTAQTPTALAATDVHNNAPDPSQLPQAAAARA